MGAGPHVIVGNVPTTAEASAPVAEPARLTVPEDFDIRPFLAGIGGGLAGAANVIMQLSWPGVGYGVMESKVDSGSAMKHPVKRARTTYTYIGVALLGTEEDRKAFRRAVNGQHAQVRNDADSKSPVAYSAMDPRLQLWVAACLYYGTVDFLERMHGPLDDATADALYAYCARFGTTLQVRESMWPANREEFARYWQESLREVSIDDAVRDYLMGLVRFRNGAKWMERRLGDWNVFVTTGFLPPEFRAAMQLDWDDARQQRFDRMMRRLGWVDRHLPTVVRNFPFNALLHDMRRRQRRGRPLV
jgi:uncharacterized protein (DUF2236 family)